MLTENAILGIMPSSGIKKMLLNKIDTIHASEGFIKSELYIVVDNIEKYVSRAVNVKAKVLSEVSERDWGTQGCLFIRSGSICNRNCRNNFIEYYWNISLLI